MSLVQDHLLIARFLYSDGVIPKRLLKCLAKCPLLLYPTAAITSFTLRNLLFRSW